MKQDFQSLLRGREGVRKWASVCFRGVWEVGREVVDLALPPLCLGCETPLARRWQVVLCGACRRDVPRVLIPCARCSTRDADPTRSPCPVCRTGLPGVPLRHAGWYRDMLRQLILGAKWSGLTGAVPVLASWCVEAAKVDGWHRDLDGYCEIPRDARRILLHGRPLSEALGREIGRRLNLPRVSPPRRRRRPAQVNLTGKKRRRNLDGAFRVTPRLRRRVAGRRVLVVDDVLTTGSTLEACAAALRAAGVREVRGLVVAANPEKV